MINLIIGKESLLTKNLKIQNKKSVVFSSRRNEDVNQIIKYVKKSKSKINLIMNNFYPSAYINSLRKDDYLKFYEQSIFFNAKLFSKIDQKKINKIIYSSSSAVYNSIRKDYQYVDTNNKSLYSSTKIAAENLIYNFCSKNNISFLILRIFNMYSEKDDKFSIVNKLKKSIYKKNQIKIFNGGQNIRDYIDVKDVVKLYSYFIKKKKLNNSVYDIGVGRGIKLIDIIEYIGKNKFNIRNISKSIDEVNISIATNEYLNKFKFNSLEEFFSDRKYIQKKKITHI